MATYFKKPSIEKAEQSVIMDRVLEQKKKELSPEEYNKYANYTTQQELLEEAARRNLLAIPDPKLQWNEKTKRYDWGDIDWSEFWQVVKGHGPCNKQRIAARVKAHEDGKWVRDAAMVYAEKQSNKEVKQAV